MLSRDALDGLKAYKYRAGGYTWLDDLHTPLWNWVVTLLPTWLAPNVITLAGLLLLVGAYAANAAYLWTQITVDAPWCAPGARDDALCRDSAALLVGLADVHGKLHLRLATLPYSDQHV